VGDFLEISQMAVEKRRPDGEEVGVARVVDLDNTPWVLARANLAATDLHDLLGTDNCKGHEAPQLRILLNSVLVVLLDIVGEVVDGNAVVLNVLHDQLLRLGELLGGKRVGATDNGNDVDARSKAPHQLDVELSETRGHVRVVTA
jgi:hypothetical protein